MASTGYLIAQIYTGRQAIPVADVAVSIIQSTNDGKEKLIAFRQTDRSGRTEPVELESPDLKYSTEPQEEASFSSYNVRLSHPAYYSVLIENVQIFSGVKSIQAMEMIPLEEFSDPSRRMRTYVITPQDL